MATLPTEIPITPRRQRMLDNPAGPCGGVSPFDREPVHDHEVDKPSLISRSPFGASGFGKR